MSFYKIDPPFRPKCCVFFSTLKKKQEISVFKKNICEGFENVQCDFNPKIKTLPKTSKSLIFFHKIKKFLLFFASWKTKNYSKNTFLPNFNLILEKKRIQTLWVCVSIFFYHNFGTRFAVPGPRLGPKIHCWDLEGPSWDHIGQRKTIVAPVWTEGPTLKKLFMTEDPVKKKNELDFGTANPDRLRNVFYSNNRTKTLSSSLGPIWSQKDPGWSQICFLTTNREKHSVPAWDQIGPRRT